MGISENERLENLNLVGIVRRKIAEIERDIVIYSRIDHQQEAVLQFQKSVLVECLDEAKITP